MGGVSQSATDANEAIVSALTLCNGCGGLHSFSHDGHATCGAGGSPCGVDTSGSPYYTSPMAMG